MLKISNFTLISIILLSILGVITENTNLDFIQIISELLLLLIYTYLSFNLKFKKYEVSIFIILCLTHIFAFPLIGSNTFLLQSKNTFLGLLSLLILPKLNFDQSSARRLLNYFLSINVLIIIFGINVNLFTQNKNIIGGGGLFQNFHYNGYILGIWAISIFSAIDFKQILLGYTIFKTGSKTSFASFFLSLIFLNRDYFVIRVKQIKKSYYFTFLLITISLFLLLIFRDLNLFKNYIYIFSLAIEDKSLLALIDQLTSFELIKNSLSIIPGDSEVFRIVEVCSPLYGCIDNEISYFNYLISLGLLNFISICILIFKNCKKIIPFLIISSIHYSYILNPLTYIIYFSYISIKNNTNNKYLKVS